MQLSREAFWVLDATIYVDCSLSIPLLNGRNAAERFNKRRHHGLSADDLADLLVFMQQQGDLVLFRKIDGLYPECDDHPRSPGVRIIGDYRPVWENPVFYPKSAVIESFRLDKAYSLRNDDLPFQQRERYPEEILSYCVSVQGAEKWEETARVDWNKFLSCSARWMNDADIAEHQLFESCRAAALSEQTLDAYFDWKLRWDSHPDAFSLSSFRRYHTERISPWRATYWKTFPEGFECDFWELSVSTTQRWNKEESARHHTFFQQSWQDHHTLFDWCNKYVRDFPFEGD